MKAPPKAPPAGGKPGTGKGGPARKGTPPPSKRAENNPAITTTKRVPKASTRAPAK